MSMFEKQMDEMSGAGGSPVAETERKGSARTNEILHKIVKGAEGERRSAEAEPRQLYCSRTCAAQSVEGGIPMASRDALCSWEFVDTEKGEEPICAQCGAEFVNDGKSVPQGIVYNPKLRAAMDAAERKSTEVNKE